MRQIRMYTPLQNGIIGVLNYAMLILFAISLAYWVWVFFKPAVLADMPANQPESQTMLSIIQAGHWFGPKQAPAPLSVSASPPSFKLIGVFTATQKQAGFAVFSLQDGRQQFVLLNQEISPSYVLQAVYQDGVTIMQNGQKTEMALFGADQVRELSQRLLVRTQTPR